MATAAPVRNPPNSGGSSSASDWDAYARGLASTALGVSSDQLLFKFFPVGITGPNAMTQVAAGTAARVLNTQGLRMSTGGAGTLIYLSHYEASMTNLVVAGAAKKFWVGSMMKLNQATIAAGELLGCGTLGFATNENCIMGARGSSSLANFVCWADAGAGGFINSGLALDTTRRLHQFWRDGTTGNYKIDALATVQGDVRPSVDSAGCITARSGAVSRDVTFTWWAVAAPLE